MSPDTITHKLTTSIRDVPHPEQTVLVWMFMKAAQRGKTTETPKTIPSSIKRKNPFLTEKEKGEEEESETDLGKTRMNLNFIE